MKVGEPSYELREIDVGVYNAPGLVIRLEAREVRVVPVANHSPAAEPLPAPAVIAATLAAAAAAMGTAIVFRRQLASRPLRVTKGRRFGA